MIKNCYRVSKRQWEKWSEQGQQFFNDIYKFQKGVILPKKFDEISDKDWKIIKWNIAFMVACMFRKKREKDWDGALFKCNDAKSDKIFLKRLSKWIFDLSGNVNVSMRLKMMAEHTRTYCGSFKEKRK